MPATAGPDSGSKAHCTFCGGSRRGARRLKKCATGPGGGGHYGGAGDLVPVGDVVLIANPWVGKPLLDAAEIEVTDRDEGRIALAGGGGSHGERVRRVRDTAGTITEIWLAATRCVPEAAAAAEMETRYAARGV